MASEPKKDAFVLGAAKALGAIKRAAGDLEARAEKIGQPVNVNTSLDYKKPTYEEYITEGRVRFVDDLALLFESGQIKWAVRLVPPFLIAVAVTLIFSLIASMYVSIAEDKSLTVLQAYGQMFKVAWASLLSSIGMGSLNLSINLGAYGVKTKSAADISASLGSLASPIYWSFFIGLGIGGVATRFFETWFNKRSVETAKRTKDNEFLRGARIVEPEQLNTIIHEMEDEQRANNEYSEPLIRFTLGGVELPANVECEGMFVTGATGVGKTVLQKDICAQVREAGKTANIKMILNDPAPEFIETMYEDGDVVFSPFDDRYLNNWDLWGELRMSYDAKSMATVLISIPAKAEYIGTKGRLVTEGLIMKTTSPEELNNLIRSDYTTIKEALMGTAGQGMINDDMKSAAESGKIMSHIITCLDLFRVLKSPAPGIKKFSFREWVADHNDRRWIFLVNRADQSAILGPLFALIFEIICMELLTLKPNTKLPREQQRRIFMNLEEMPTSLPVIPSLKKLLAQGRKYGLGCIVTAQSKDQLEGEEQYGMQDTVALLQNLATWFVYRMRAKDAAEFISDQLGTFEEVQKGSSIKVGPEEDDHGGMGWNSGITERKVILTSEVQTLPKLTCFLICGSLPATKIRVGWKNDDRTPIPSFIPSERAKLHHPMLAAANEEQGNGESAIEGTFEIESNHADRDDQSDAPKKAPKSAPAVLPIQTTGSDVLDLDEIFTFGSEPPKPVEAEYIEEPPADGPADTPEVDNSWIDSLNR